MFVAIQADGGPDRGFGHVVRAKTIGDELRRHGHEVLFLTQTPESIIQLYGDEESVQPIDGIRADVVPEEVDVLLVDNPEVDIQQQRELRTAAGHLGLVRDDRGAKIHCDFLLNYHLYATSETYENERDELIRCVGGEFFIADDSFREVSQDDPPWRDPPQRALITMGGSDVRNTTPRVIRAFEGTGMELDVVVGPGVTTRDEIKAAGSSVAESVHYHDAPETLAILCFEADLAVTALGLTAYELLLTGTPMVGLPQAADQYPKVRAFRERDAGLVVDDDASGRIIKEAIEQLLGDSTERWRLRELGRNLISADGVEKVVRELETL
jgi:spore coat polysaccharide biosynthesis predicted glycosyltransferase SpsG